MEEYKIDLTQCRITKFSSSVCIEEKVTSKINVSYSASVFEPVDPSDPTVKVQVDAVYRTEDSNDFSISCVADFIFNLDPIPENRVSVIRDNTAEIIQKELTNKVLSILKDMGHKVMFNV